MADEQIEMTELSAEELDEQHRVRLEKLAALKEAGKDPYKITKFDVNIYNKEIRDRFEELENSDVTIAGRMMTRRIMGKASFMDIRDGSDRMQVYVRKDDVGEDAYADFKKWDLGDIIGIKGKVFRTKMGEISVHAEEITLLSKSLLPLPEKWHG
ncbi:MAG: lysine--tRNA ligase, partial [Oscillospiraceae bacterium]|nr:lysine--tRNA ligase [Oscillospiraceae bacterium]